MKSILVTLIVSMIIAIIVSIVCSLLKKQTKKVILIMVAIVVVCTLLSVLYSTTNCTEYQEWEIASETEIVPLSVLGEKTIYTRFENGEYRYKYEINEIPLWSETAKEYDVSSVKATTIEDVNCDIPEVIRYEREPVKGSFASWTLATFVKPEVKYVIYVPAGTVES